MPGDMLSGVIALFQSSGIGQLPVRYGWEIYQDQVYTNFEEVYIDYQATVDESKMPPYFIDLLTYALASKLSFVITDQISKADYFRAEAYGTPADSGRGGKMRAAMNIDGRGKPPQVIEDYSLISVRY